MGVSCFNKWLTLFYYYIMLFNILDNKKKRDYSICRIVEVKIVTQAEVVILGLLYKTDRYGYELEKHIEKNQMRQWTDIGFSSIYNILNKLHNKELIDFRYASEKGGPKRKMYHILDKGTEAFETSILSMLKTPALSKQDIDVAIIFSAYFDNDVVIKALVDHKVGLSHQMEFVKTQCEEKFSHRKRVVMYAQRSLMHMETEIQWLDYVIEELSTTHPEG